MFKRELALVFWILCAFQLAAGRPSKETAKNDKNAALVASYNAASVKPDVELIDIGSTTQAGEDAYRRAAVANGMDPTIVAEVIRTKKPVVKTEFDESGAKRTTTYNLEVDGSISRHTLTEYRPTVQKVHTTSLAGSPTKNADSKIDKDWEWNPTNVPKFGTPSTHTYNIPSFTPTWTTPAFNNGNSFGSNPYLPTRPNQDGRPTIQLPESWNTQHWPNTNTFEHIDPTNSGTETKTVINDDGTRVTTTHTVGPTKWTTHTYSYPDVSTLPKFDIQTTTPFPSLQDFLNSQYGPTTKRTFTNTIPNLVPGGTPVTKISVDDLPTVRVPVKELKPEDNVPFNFQPNIQSTKTYTKTIQTHGDPSAADLDPKMREILREAGISPDELFNSKNGTITKTRREPDGRIVTTTYRVRTVPNDDVEDNVNYGGSHPVIPSFTSTFDKPRGPFFIVEPTTPRPHSHVSSSHGGALFPTATAPKTPQNPFIPHTVHKGDRHPEASEGKPVITATSNNPIEEFLAKLGLSSATIEASNGELTKTIVDEKGRVLTATFVLSTVKNNDNYNKDKTKPNPLK